MRDMRGYEVEEVIGGGIGDGMPEFPGYPGPSREEVERQIDQLRDFLEEQERRNALPHGA